MDWIRRILEEKLDSKLAKGKVWVIYGARRVGKTSLVENLIKDRNNLRCFIGTGDDITIREILSSEKLNLINANFNGYDLVFIDEAQRIPNIGWGLKLLVDSNPNMLIIATGSSSFELANIVGAPLTGRQQVYTLFSISYSELVQNYGGMKTSQQLEQYLIYGTYPETLSFNNDNEKQKYLLNLRNSYLFKDILELENIRNASKIVDLLKLLAFQIGQEVSLNELSLNLGIAKQTVDRYLDLLEKTFIIIKVRGYSTKNLRKEITKTCRYYFWDNGVRNALIQNFNDVSTRSDMGQLWENFCFVERIKKQSYNETMCNHYFWRTYDQQEVDMIEEIGDKLLAFEFKWNPRKETKVPKAFATNYPNAEFKCIAPENIITWLS